MWLCDYVYVILRPHQQHSIARRVNQKLVAYYYGLFWHTSYDPLVTSRIHLVFHASLSKRVVGYKEAESDFSFDLEPGLPMHCVPQSRSILWGDETVDQWLICWDYKGRGSYLGGCHDHTRTISGVAEQPCSQGCISWWVMLLNQTDFQFLEGLCMSNRVQFACFMFGIGIGRGGGSSMFYVCLLSFVTCRMTQEDFIK